MLFLISVVTSFIELGNYPGAKITLYDTSQELIATGQILSFSTDKLVQFGAIVIALTVILYVGWNYIYKNLSAKLRK